MSEISATILPPAPPLAPPPAEGFTRSRNLHNRLSRVVNVVMLAGCWLAALCAISVLFLILGYILYKGASSMSWSLFTNLPSDHPAGLRNCIAGTLMLIGMASVIGIPVGMLCGVYLAEYAKEGWFSHAIRLVVDVLAGVPSILVGVLASVLFVMPVHRNSAWAGAAALAFIMCPIVARTTEEMLKLVPKALREASIGLGASKSQTLFRVVLPAAASGVITGIMLAVARVAGETAPLIFTVLGYDSKIVTFTSSAPFVHVRVNDSFPALPLKIFNIADQQDPNLIPQAWAGMMVLIVIVLGLNICVRVVSSRKR